jgi:hypothetical protein
MVARNMYNIKFDQNSPYNVKTYTMKNSFAGTSNSAPSFIIEARYVSESK